jgi:lipopolysaccharide-induced tumor necrosis factor-alpha factor
MYSVPEPQQQQQQQASNIKYIEVNPTIPGAYGAQFVPVAKFGRNSIQCTSANCRSTILTRVEQTNGLLTWLLCIFLCIFGCWLGCCLIPFCITDLQNVQHYCPNCNAFIGEYQPL